MTTASNRNHPYKLENNNILMIDISIYFLDKPHFDHHDWQKYLYGLRIFIKIRIKININDFNTISHGRKPKMINKKLKLVTALGCAMGIAAPASVFATNGMFLIAPGTKSRGMGGVAITQSHDVITSAVNPATMAELKTNRFDMGGDILIVNSEASMGESPYDYTEKSTPDHMALAEGIYMMPALGASWTQGDISYGFTMVPVGGGGSRYDYNLYNCANDSPTDCNNKMGVSLMIMNINPTIAYKINDKHSVGATLVIGLQVFKSYGLDKFNAFADEAKVLAGTVKLSDQGTDISYGAGIRLGWLGHFMDNKLTVGAEYTSKTYMTEFEDYEDLFAEQGDLDTPGNIGLGIAYDINKDLSIALDVNYIMYEDVASIANATTTIGGANYSTAFPVDRETNYLGADEGLGFNWKNQTAYKIGLVYQYDPKWTLRGGWNYAKSPLDEQTDILFSMVAPAITQHHLTMGATYQWDQDMEFSFSYIHAFEYEQNGPTYINTTGGFTMAMDAIGASLGVKF